MLKIENLINKIKGKFPYEYLGGQLLINGDCLKVMELMEDKSVDLVLTDPPYGLGYDKQAGKVSGSQNGTMKAPKGIYRQTNWDIKPEKEIFDMILNKSLNQIIFGGEHLCSLLPQSRGWIVWDKHTGDNNFSDCELAWTSESKPIKKYDWIWNGMLQQDMKNKEERFHPTQKPVGLFCKILQDYSKENDLIFDGFSGSFTTSIACIRTNRQSICIEKDEEYYKLGVNRVKEELRQEDMFRC